jgi:hypothetical protein
MFLQALKENIEKYEKKYGVIKIEPQASSGTFGFTPPVKDDKVN